MNGTNDRINGRAFARLSFTTATLAGALWAGNALAQGDYGHAEIEQTGSGNSATIEQDTQPIMNGLVHQDGTNNTARLLQPAAIGPKEAEIYQLGSDHQVEVLQAVATTASLIVVQEGTAQEAYIDHRGNWVAGRVGQRGEGNALDAAGGAFTLVQDGTHNTLSLDQDGIYASAGIYQAGNANEAQVVQIETVASALALEQNGDSNHAYVEQVDIDDRGQSAALSFTGDRNQLYMEQSNANGFFQMSLSGDDNRMQVLQSNASNDAELHIKNSHRNIDDLQQVGLDERLEIDRLDTLASNTTVVQSGFSDQLSIQQENTRDTTLYLVQDGHTGRAYVRQSWAESSTASLDQNTRRSHATIEQGDVYAIDASVQQYGGNEGTDLIASIYQTHGSELSIAHIRQTGEGNVALIDQSDTYNAQARILQSGTQGYAEIIQTGAVDSRALIEQSASGYGGEGWSASIHQTGTGQDAVIRQM